MNSIKIPVLLMLLLSTSASGQSIRKAVDNAWIYIGTWDSFKEQDDIELVKNWSAPAFCVVSFENGLYTFSDGSGNKIESGKWSIKKADGKIFLVINTAQKQFRKFEIVSVEEKVMKLQRVTNVMKASLLKPRRK